MAKENKPKLTETQHVVIEEVVRRMNGNGKNGDTSLTRWLIKTGLEVIVLIVMVVLYVHRIDASQDQEIAVLKQKDVSLVESIERLEDSVEKVDQKVDNMVGSIGKIEYVLEHIGTILGVPKKQ